ncbi:MAG: hypothetical protein ACJ72I_00950, partial [Pseudonocardiaceae bacterium]
MTTMLRRTLSNLGIHLDVVSRREEAFASTEEAVEHYRRLSYPRGGVVPWCGPSQAGHQSRYQRQHGYTGRTT